MKILIPIIDKWKGFKLETDNLKELNNFLKSNGYDLHNYSKDLKLESVSFRWNPYGVDYPPYINLKVGEIFMFNEENPEIYRIITDTDIEESWIIENENKN